MYVGLLLRTYLCVWPWENRSFVHQIRVGSYLFRDFYTRRKTRRKRIERGEFQGAESILSIGDWLGGCIRRSKIFYRDAFPFTGFALCLILFAFPFFFFFFYLFLFHSYRRRILFARPFLLSISSNLSERTRPVQGTALLKAKTRIEDRLVNDTFRLKRKMKKYEDRTTLPIDILADRKC